MSSTVTLGGYGSEVTIPLQNIDYVILDSRGSQIVLKSGKRINCEYSEAVLVQGNL